MIIFGYKSKFSSILRAFSAIAIGLVMVISNNATVTVVKIIAALLFAAGVISLVYGFVNRKSGALPLLAVNAVIDIVAGLLLFFFPASVANFIVYLIGFALLAFGVLQIIVLSSTMSMLGGGFMSLILPAVAVVGGMVLLFNPFSMSVMSIIAGIALIFYGISELKSLSTIEKAKVEYEIRNKPAEPEPEQPREGVIKSDLSAAKDVDYEKVDIQ